MISLALAVMLLLVCSMAALASGPALAIDSLANSTAAPGSTVSYLLQVTNVGDANTDGSEIELIASLPTGLTGVDAGGGGFSCTAGDGISSVVGASVIKCTSTDAIGVHTASNYRKPVITVAVDPGATSWLTTRFEVSGGGASSAATADPTRITSMLPGFGIDAFDGQVTADPGGEPFTQAGGHPYAASTSIDFNTSTNTDLLKGQAWPVEATKDILVELPPGFVGNPTAVAKCTASDLANAESIQAKALCPAASQVGTVTVRLNAIFPHNVFGPLPVFSLVPPPNVPARFGFNVAGTVVTFDAELRSGSDYGLSVNVRNVSQGLDLAGTSLTFWGVPSDASHDALRACPGQFAPWEGGPSCTSGASRTAFLRNPTSCTSLGVGLKTTLNIDSWVHPGAFVQGAFLSHLPLAYPFVPGDWGPQQGPTGCGEEPFDPTLSATPGTPAKTGQPSAFTFDVAIPQSDDPEAIGEADLKKAVVTLPAGVRVSPSSADGLGACTPEQVGLVGTGFSEPNRIHFDTADATCPGRSKLGSLTITTPLLDEPLTGSIYLATPHDNPFDSLVAIYLVAKGSGLIVKLPGKVEVDPDSGRLTATFDDNPQTPFSKLHLEFKGGPRAPIVTPDACGTYTTHAELTSWSGKVVESDSDFTLDQSGDGSPCAAPGFSPGFTAGTANPGAGKDTSFLLSLTRGDQDQRLRFVTVAMPTGVLGRIASTVLCSNDTANAGNCGDASKIGSVTVGAGAGPNPFYITNGRAYITGPYKGAPFGLSIVVPAVAGPFDLGNVVVRAAIFVDRHTAALRVVSDPLPTVLQGIPLDVRDVRVTIDRPKFIVNPTSCAEKQVLGIVGSVIGTIARVSSRFQVGECASLPLTPKLALNVGAKGHTKASVSTPFTATLTQTPGQTNLRSVSVSLPTTINALLPVVNRACKLTEFNAGTCTSKARVGSAVAVTPLLRDPLKGSAYFVKNPSRAIPDLMVALRGQVDFDLVGKVTIPGGKRLATAFDAIPDVPITKFTLRLVSGKNGPVGTAANLCSASSKAAAAAVGFRGQNGKQLLIDQRLHVSGCPKAKKSAKKSRR